MLITGFQKMSLLDYPDKIAAIVFTQGCNFACGYCHNPELISKIKPPGLKEFSEKSVLDFLKTRKGLLDGVVVTGGEPTLHEDLGDFLKKIKDLGFLVKLDTNGGNPEHLRKLIQLKLVDYIAMDIKHAPKKYQELVKNDCLAKIRESIKIIRSSGVDYEFRSTIAPYLHTEDDFCEMGKMIKGAKHWYLQNFRPGKTLQRSLEKERSFTEAELRHLASIAKNYVNDVTIRS